MPAKFAAAVMSTLAAVAMVVIGGSSAALAAGPHFAPKATDASWDGAVATVTFQEVEVPVEWGATTISVKATVDVDVVCRQGESTLHIHRSATALKVADYPRGAPAPLAGTASLPLEVRGLKVSGFTCVTQRVSVTATLEDFWTGATLVHKT